MNLGVLTIGSGFFLERVAGDKNFWFDLLPLLSEQGLDVTVISVNDRPASEDVLRPSGAGISLINWRRPLHGKDPDRFLAVSAGGRDYRHKHNPAQEQLELLMTLVAHLYQLRRLIRERSIRVIHFMDNMGVVMPVLKTLFPRLFVSHSAMSYMPRGRNYDRYLSVCFSKLDRIAPYSDAYADVLMKLGIRPECVQVIRWGVMPGRNAVSAEEKAVARAKLGVPQGQRLVVWSGPVQQVGEADFIDAVQAAEQVMSIREDVRFIFSFKPRSFREEYRQYERERISIGQPDISFPVLLGSADYFLSSVRNLRSTLAPPLTWLEAMNNGVPIITTPALGVDEVVVDGSTGYTASDIDHIADAILRAMDDPGYLSVAENCREMIRNRFNIGDAARAYCDMWKKGVMGSSRLGG